MGLTAAGFSAPTQAEIEAELRASIAAATALGADVSTDPSSPLGQLLVIFAAALADVWSEAQNVYTAAGLTTAGGAPLAHLARRYGLSPHPAEPSRQVLTLSGTNGTTVPAGSAVRLGANDTRWTTDTAALIGPSGTVDVYATCETTGSITVAAGGTWTIDTPVAGWTGVANATDTLPDDIGRDAETDAALRARAVGAARLGVTSSGDGVRGAVLAVTDVTECLVIQNDSQYVDAEGRAPHSMEVVVRGGADADVAAAILARAPAGIETLTSVTAPNQVTENVADLAGDLQAVTFSRPDLIDVHVAVEYTPLPTFPTDGVARIQQAILDFGNGLGLDSGGVFPPNVEAAIFRAFSGSVFSSFNLYMGLAPAPTRADAVPTSRTELAVFDSSRVTITRV